MVVAETEAQHAPPGIKAAVCMVLTVGLRTLLKAVPCLLSCTSEIFVLFNFGDIEKVS